MSIRMTRRGAIGAMLAAGVAPLVMPGSVLASVGRSGRRRGVNEQITLGIIGMGIRGRNIFNGYLKESDRARVLAIAEVDGTRLEHYKKMIDEAYGTTDCAAYVDYLDLLARDDIDAVIIATPDHWHATQCLHACATGKDIYCEKPLTHTLREGQALIEAVGKHGRVFQTGSQQRSEYGHKFARAVELARAGRIGRVLNVNVGVGDPPRACDLPGEEMEAGLDWDKWLGPAPMRPYHSELSPRGVHGHYPRWRRYWEYSGGYLADMGAHHYDIAQWGLEEDRGGPVRVEPPEDGESMRGATLHYADGVVVTHGGPSGTTFIGTSGMIHVDRGRLEAVPGEILDEELPEEQRMPRNASHMDDWLDCIESRERPICDVEVGSRTAMVNQLVNLAYRHRRPLRWDHQAWRFVDDAEANGWLDYERRSEFALPSV